MKKRFILLAILIFLLGASMVFAVGCVHVCDVSEKVATEEYLKNKATCTTKPEYFYSCKCGIKGSKTFFLGSALGHKFEDYSDHEQATCETNKTLIATCKNGCGETDIKEVAGSMLEHKFENYVSNNDATCSKDATGTATCGRGCGAVDTKTLPNTKVAHKFEDYFNDNNATCMADATKTARCSYGCGKTNTISIPGTRTDHVYGDFISNGDATCMSDGTRSAHCKYDCGDYLSGPDVGSKIPHSFVEYEYNQDATCFNDGTKTAFCEYGCKTEQTVTATGTKLEHVFELYVKNNDATCKDNATETAQCKFGCGESHYREIPNSKASHVFTTYKYDNNAKCEVDGTETAYCDYGCGEHSTRTKLNTALDHIYGKWTSIGNDKHSRVCARDAGHVQTESCYGGTATEDKKAVCSACGSEYGNLLDHQHVFDKKITTEQYLVSTATCMNKATYYYSCKCGESNKNTFEYGNLAAHIYGEYVSNGDATCYSEGTMSAYCKYGCGDFLSRTEQGSIVDHSFTNYVFDNNSTYDEDGTETAFCDFKCGQHHTRTAVNSKLKLPEYYSNDIIDIYAYSTPTHANWDGNTNNPEGITDKVFSDIANAGFTGVQALREGYYKTGSSSLRVWHNYAAADALNVMKLCEKYGLKYMIRDWAFMGSFDIFYGEGNNGSLWRTYFNNGGTIESGLEEMFSIKNVKDAVKHVAYAGHNLWDEPDIPQMEKLIPVVRKYKQLAPHGDPYFNLLPCYATNEQLGGTYAEYIDYYCKNIAPMLGYISYDYYPYSINSSGVSRVSEKYLYNFQLVAEQAKLNNLEFRLYIQAGNYGGDSRECGGVEDYRHQMYTAMAYGVRYFVYFTYGYGMSDNGLVDTNLNPTAKYYYAKQANSEVHALEDVMLNFDWQGIMYKNASKYSPNAAFNHLKGFNNVFTSHSRISNYTVSQDTVVGCFKDKENRDGFMFVNYVDPAKKQMDNVTVKFNNAKKLIVYELGVRKVYDAPANGEFTFSLQPGEGRFIIPIA